MQMASGLAMACDCCGLGEQGLDRQQAWASVEAKVLSRPFRQLDAPMHMRIAALACQETTPAISKWVLRWLQGITEGGHRKRTTVCWFLCILARFLPQAWHMIFVWAGDSTNMWIAWRSPDCNGLGDRCAMRPWPWHAWDTFRCAGSPHQELQSGRLTRFASRNSTQHRQDGLGFGPGSRLQPAPRPGSSLRSEDADSLGTWTVHSMNPMRQERTIPCALRLWCLLDKHPERADTHPASSEQWV